MNTEDLKSLIKEELNRNRRLKFMQHLAKKHPDLSPRQIGEIYKLYKDGTDIEIAVKQVAGMNEQEEEELDQTRLGARTMTRSAQATASREKAQAVASGEELSGIDPKERAILTDLDKVMSAIAEKDDLVKYKAILQNVVNQLRKKAGV